MSLKHRTRQTTKHAITGSYKSRSTLTRGNMLSDVCMVVVWAATIPGLMWLGAAGGF